MLIPLFHGRRRGRVRRNRKICTAADKNEHIRFAPRALAIFNVFICLFENVIGNPSDRSFPFICCTVTTVSLSRRIVMDRVSL